MMGRLTKTYSDGSFGVADKLPCGENSYTFKDMLIEKLGSYEETEEQGLLLQLPCKVGDIVYVDSSMLPIEDMECYEDVDNEIPAYFPVRIVSFRFAKRNFVKIAVKEKWLHEWIDDETGPESGYIECEKNFTIPLSSFGKTIFLTREETEAKLKKMEEPKNTPSWKNHIMNRFLKGE